MKKIQLLSLASILLLAITAFTLKDEKTEHDLGSFSISLNVKDIQKSFKFYQELGFQPINGTNSLQQKWIVLTNGKAKIGLFQGLFPKNTITFNPSDARKIHKILNDKGIKSTFSTGLDKKEGPCSFAINDPDGNPILIDQHK